MSSTPPPAPPDQPWGTRTRDRWFYAALGLAALGIAYVFSWFAEVLLFASVITVVSWPMYTRLSRVLRGRQSLAAGLSALVVALVGVVPLAFLGYLFVDEAISLVESGYDFVRSEDFAGWLQQVTTSVDWMPRWLRRLLPDDFELRETLVGYAEGGALRLIDWIGLMVPSVLGFTVNLVLGAAIFFIVLVSLFLEGPRVLRVIQDLSPMEDAYETRVFAVFGEFAHRVVLGTLATALIQGAAAGIGYAIAGVDRIVFFAMLTAVGGFVPVVGTTVVWIPLSVGVALDRGIGWGVFVFAWGAMIAQLDNFLRPLLMGGRTHVHPVLLFLAVLGGIGWWGFAGIIVGPLVLAAFLALYTIYSEDYLGRTFEPQPRGRALTRLREAVGRMSRSRG